MAERTVNVTINYKVNTAEVQKAEGLSKNAQRATDNLRKSTDEYAKSVKNAGEEGGKSFFNLQNAIKGISIAVLAKEIFDFTKKVIEVRGEFQKFEAVLTNTLGSRSQALIALGRINEFAKTTPYSVKELTDSFIKLANRGVQPTIQQMRAIGDLAATLGKDFGQVTEAILDVNNPERWKEIGIQSETVGNKVKLSFKGITQEVDRTVEGVTKAITAFGQLNGVAGSTEAISQTLSGQVSNLDDAWTQLLNTIGKGNEGVLSEAVNLLSRAIGAANELLKSDLQRYEELQAKILGRETERLESLAKSMGDANRAAILIERERLKQLQLLNDKFIEIRDKRDALKGGIFGPDAEQSIMKQRLTEQLDVIRMQIEVYSNDLPNAIKETVAKLEEQSKKQEKQPGIVEKLREKIKALNEEIEKTTNRKDLGPGGRLIRELEIAQAKLNDLLRAHKEVPKSLEIKELKPTKDVAEKFMDETRKLIENIELHKAIFHVPIKLTPFVQDDGSDELKKAFKKAQEEIEQASAGLLSDQLHSIVDTEAKTYQTRLDNLESFYDKQIDLAGDNERAKKDLEFKRERETAELRKQIFEKEKKARRSHAIIDMAASIVKTGAQLGFPAAIPFIALATLEGLSQLAIINRETPKFAKGVLNLNGPGSETSDSIPAYLSRGESVMTAKETKRSLGLLTAIRNNKIDDRILNRLDFGGGVSVMNDERIVRAIENQKFPKAPDIVKQGRELYEVYEDKKSFKRYIRSKSI